jgi:FixJ family two-component response regulator
VPPLIHIVDDDSSFRTSLARLLSTSGYDVAVYDSAEKLLQLRPTGGLGCILLDFKMPGLSGAELQVRLAKLGSPLPIIFLSGYGDIPTTVKAIKAGAEDFLSKPISREDLLGAIERALDRCQTALVQREQIEVLQARVSRLTPQERKVFAMVARGQINKQIAFALGTSERTIKAHRQKVMQKLNAKSLLELVAIAEQLDVLHGDDRPAP